MTTAEATAMETSIQTLRSLPAANLCCFSPLETRGIASPFSGSTSPVAEARASLRRLRSTAPVTHGLLAALLVGFVGSHQPATRRVLRGHAVCCPSNRSSKT